jgi:hypothetical protein
MIFIIDIHYLSKQHEPIDFCNGEEFVFFEVRTGFLNVIYMNFVRQNVKK